MSTKNKLLARLGGLAVSVLVPGLAAATLTVTPLTWNVIGLDSNSPAAGPRHFPVGARVCSNVATTNVAVNWLWDSANANVNLRPGSLATLQFPSIGAGACADAYFEVEVTPVAAAYDTTRRYRITATDASGTASTPQPRELYVEHLISQSRNAVTGIKVDGIPVPAGGSVALVVGNTYTVELTGGTATQGYSQFETFIDFSNAIFQVLSVQTTYSANNSPYVANPSDKLYADACLWENNPASPNYRSCVGGDFKAGGSTVTTVYTIRVIGGAGTNQALSTLLYDFSGSSYHYNADYGISGFVASVVDPASLGFAKAFAPSPTVAGGTSTLTFTITNPNPAPVTGVGFSDNLPSLSGGPMVVATPAVFSTSGCGTPTFAPAAGASSFTFAGGTVAGNGSCTVSVQVRVPASPTTGTYVNTSNALFVGTTSTGKTATASLGLTAASSGTGSCGLPLATWTMATAAGTTSPPLFSTKATDVASATASAGAGVTALIDTLVGDPVNSWATHGYTNGTSPVAGDEVVFAVNTTNYTNVTFAFAASRSAQGPQSLQLAYSTDGTTYTDYGGVLSAAEAFATYAPALPGPANTAGVTHFRISGYNAANSGTNAKLYLDNIRVEGCQTSQPPTIAKAFAPSAIAVNGTSTLTFTLTNPNATALAGVRFADALPAGVQVAASPNATTTCGGAPTWAPGAGASSLDFGTPVGATIAGGASCTVSVNVTTTTAGPHVNVSGFVSSTEGGTNTGAGGSATATLTGLVPPTIGKDFAPNPIPVNGTSILKITIANPNTSDALTGVAFTDAYPSGLVNANPLVPAVVSTCGGSVTAAAGGGSISLASGSLAAGASCTIEVPVTSANAASYANSTSPVSATGTGNGNSANATLVVSPPNPAIALAKRVSTSATGPWLNFVTVTPGTPLYYQFTVENTGDVPLTSVAVADPVLAGASADPAGCTWPSPLPVATPSVDPLATCVRGPVNAVLGVSTNTATAQGSFGGTTVTSLQASAEHAGATPGFNLNKQIAPAPDGPWTTNVTVAAGSTVHYRFTITNTGALPLSSIAVNDPQVSTTACTFVDPLPVGGATMCVVGPVTATGAPGATVTNTATAQGTNGATFTTPASSASYTLDVLSADLSITKTNGVAGVTAGAPTTYAIAVTNNGPDGVANAAIADTAPPGVTFGAWTCAVTNAGSGGTVTTACGAASGSGNLSTTATVKPGATLTYTVNAGVAPGATGTIANTATVTPPSGVVDPVPANNSATDVDPVAAVADLSITKTDGVTSVSPGGSTTYTIVVGNAGPSAANGALVSDLLPPGIAAATWTCAGAAGGSCPPAGAGSLAVAVDLPVGGSVTFTVTATVAASATGTLVNTATVAPPPGVQDPDPSDDASTDTDTIVPTATSADLSVTKTDGATSVSAGGATTYTIVVANAGPDAAVNASLTDALPAATTFTSLAVPPGWTCSTPAVGANGTVACSMPSLASGASATFALTVAIDPAVPGGSTVTNTATVVSATPDATPANNTATDTDTVAVVPANADVSVTKTDGTASVTAGGSTSYTIVVANAGPQPATSVQLSDALPAGTTFASLSAPAGWTCTTPAVGGTGTVSCSIASLASAASAGFTLTVGIDAAVPGGSSLANTATVAASTPDPNGANNSATDVDTVNASPVIADLAVTKTNGATTVTSGTSTSYTVTVTNNGPAAVTAATLSDPAVTGLVKTAVACAASPGVCNVAPSIAQLEGGVALPALASGASYRIVVTANVTATSGSVSNTASVRPPAGTTDPNPANDSSTDTDAVVPASVSADLVIAKSNGGAVLVPGGATVYTIVVTNNGPGEVTNATVVDTAPAGLTFGAWTCAVTNPGSGGTVTTACGATGGAGNVNATVTMKVGAVVTFTVPATVAPGASGNVTNTATVTPPPGVVDPSPGNESSSDVDVVVTAAAPVEVPTLSEWGLAFMSLLLAVAGMRRRRAGAGKH